MIFPKGLLNSMKKSEPAVSYSGEAIGSNQPFFSIYHHPSDWNCPLRKEQNQNKTVPLIQNSSEEYQYQNLPRQILIGLRGVYIFHQSPIREINTISTSAEIQL